MLARDLLSAIRVSVPDVDTTIEHLVKSGGAALGEPMIEAFLAELARAREELVIVLEDVHILTGSALVEDLGTVVTSLPANVRAIVSTRRDLPWNLRQLRLDGRLVELRGADLAFDADQARQMLVAVSGRDLTGDQVVSLLDRTDGWAAGLQLAAISLQNASDVAGFIHSFAGTDQLVADYLLEEVIERQTSDVQQFMMRTSVLDELSVDLCDAVTGSGNARAMLDELTNRSLFLIPLDRSGERFRYHHLFADVLAHRLRASDPAAASDVHAAAARWLIDHGHEEASIPHLIAAGERDQAFEIITQLGHRLFERGESATLVHWLTLIDELDPHGPGAIGVNLLAAHIAADQGLATAETYRRLSRRTDLTAGERATSDALYAILVFRDLPPDIVVKTVHDVLAALPLLDERDVVDFLGIGGLDSIQVLAEYAAAIARFLQANLQESHDSLERVLNLPGMRYPVWRIYTLSSLALVRAWTGHSTEALQLTGSAIEAARALGFAGHPGVTHAHMAAAVVHLDRLDLDRASAHLAQSELQNRRRTSSVAYFDLQRALNARLASLADGPAMALAILREPAASVHEPAVLVNTNRALETRLLIGARRLSTAHTLLGDADADDLTSARIDLALAEGDVVGARHHLNTWNPHHDDIRAAIGHLLRTGTVADAEGDQDMAADALGEAIALAERQLLRWPFLEARGALRLLQRNPRQRSQLFDDAMMHAAQNLDGSALQSQLFEPLSERELKVLEYLPGRLKNQEIAAELYVSVNTLKSHLRNIYRKLDVADRDEAVAKATDIGLL